MARHMDEIALPTTSTSPAGETVEEQRIVELGAGTRLCREHRLCGQSAAWVALAKAGRSYPKLVGSPRHDLPLEEASLQPTAKPPCSRHRRRPPYAPVGQRNGWARCTHNLLADGHISLRARGEQEVFRRRVLPLP